MCALAYDATGCSCADAKFAAAYVPDKLSLSAAEFQEALSEMNGVFLHEIGIKKYMCCLLSGAEDYVDELKAKAKELTVRHAEQKVEFLVAPASTPIVDTPPEESRLHLVVKQN